MVREVHAAITTKRRVPSRALASVLAGAGATVLLTCLTILIAWLVALSHSASGTATGRLVAVLMNLFHLPVFLIAIVIALVVLSLLFWLAARPRALAAYLREAAAAQEPYHQRYTPLALALPSQPLRQGQQNQAQPAPALDFFQQDTSFLLTGEPGMGKTMALREYLYKTAQDRWSKIRGRERLPIYVPLQHYALYLKARLQADPQTGQILSPPVTFLDFLGESNLPGLSHLDPFLQRLSEKGRLLLLCDGLDEVDAELQPLIADELAEEIRQSDNRVVLACRRYQVQEYFAHLVQDGRLEWLELQPLDQEQVRSFVENAAENVAQPWQYTVGQVMQGLNFGRLRALCTNPMLLSCLVEVVDKVGIGQIRQLDTRGSLLNAFVAQIIEQQRSARKQAPATESVIEFLGQLAYVARRTGGLSAIQLLADGEPADALQAWLEEHPSPYPFRTNPADQLLSFTGDDVQLLLQFALDAGLLVLAQDGVLRFSHELIAEYCIAAYFTFEVQEQGGQGLLREDILADVARWSGPVALWAGLVDDPLALAARLQLARRNNQAMLPALALSLVAAGLTDVAPRTKTASLTPLALPESMKEALAKVIENQGAREHLAQLCTVCVQNGGEEIYASLPLLLPIPGVADFIERLDSEVVPNLLCDYLVDIVNEPAYDAQTMSLLDVLGRFGDVVLERVSALSQPGGGRSERLRFAAIQILGRVGTQRAVEQILPFLGSPEQSIGRAAVSALVRSGPQLALPLILPLLENSSPTPTEEAKQLAVLDVLTHFLREQPKAERELPSTQYQHVLNVLLALLGSDYAGVARLQEKARNLLVKLGRQTTRQGAKALDMLVQSLSTPDEVQGNNVMQVLLALGPVATERLLAYLHEQPPNAVRVRIIEVLRGTRDQRALPALLQQVADQSPSMQQQVAIALAAFTPESIPGLIDLVTTNPEEMVASRAAQILVSIGSEVVEPVASSIYPIVPERTRLLVEVLEEVPDAGAIPALVSLLQEPQTELLLRVTAIRALGQIPDPRVVPPLLSMVEQPLAQLYEEAITSLGHLGEIALPDLLAALDVWQEPGLQERARRAILCMVPFPGEALMDALAASSDELAGQIVQVLSEQGPEAAQALVNHLLDTDTRVNASVHQALDAMRGPIVVPALLEALNRPAWQPVVSAMLLKYPEAIAPLVSLLSDPQRDTVAATILPQFGMDVLDPLLVSLSENNLEAQEYASRVIVTLVRQNPEEIDQVVQLFGATLSRQAREVLLDALTGPLADVSLPALMIGLEDAHLVEGVSEALVRLESEDERTGDVLEQLLHALREPGRQWGAERTLVKIGARAVQSVGGLITDSDTSVALTAQRILMNIGTNAFPFIWATSSDTSNPARRQAALSILNQMPPAVIQEGLLWYLMSDQPEEVAMAVALLLERIHNESRQGATAQETIPVLLEHAEQQDNERTLPRILALLLFIGGPDVVRHLVQALYDRPEYTGPLTQAFLLLGKGTAKALEDILRDSYAPLELRAAVAAILSMIEPAQSVIEYVRNISSYGYGVTPRPETLKDADRLNVALRALGGLLAGGHWDVPTLLDRRAKNMQSDLVTALLGWRYGAYIEKLLDDLRTEREMHQMDVRNLQIEIDLEQQKSQSLQEELEHMSEKHDLRVEELEHAKRQHQEMRNRLEHREQQRRDLERINEQIKLENGYLKRENDSLHQQISLLRHENNRLKQKV